MTLLKKIMWASLLSSGVLIMIISSALLDARGNIEDKGLEYLIENLLSVTSLIMITFGVLYWYIDDFKLKDARFKQAMSTLEVFMRQEYRPAVWTKFRIKKNKERKKLQFEEVLRVEFHNLEKTATEDDFLLWEKGVCERDTDTKETNTYCKKRQVLELKSTDAWLDKNLNSINVDYDEIDIDVIVSGEYFPKKKKGIRQVNDFVTKNKNFKIIRSRVPMILLGTGMIMFITSIWIDLEFSANVVANIAFKIMAIAWNVFVTIRFSDQWNLQVTLKDAMFQAGIVQEYRTYVKKEIDILKEEQTDGND